MLAMGLCVAAAGPVSAMRLVAARITAPDVAATPAEVATTSALPIAPATKSTLATAAVEQERPFLDPAPEHPLLTVEQAVEAPAVPDRAIARGGAPAASPRLAAIAVPPPPAVTMAEPPVPAAPPVPPVARAAAIGNALLDVDTLVRMKIHGVSARFISEMAAAGYTRLSADQLINMRIHGVGAELARRATAAAGRRPSPDELVDLAIHGSLR